MDHCSLSLHIVVLIVLFCENTSLKKLHSLSNDVKFALLSSI